MGRVRRGWWGAEAEERRRTGEGTWEHEGDGGTRDTRRGGVRDEGDTAKCMHSTRNKHKIGRCYCFCCHRHWCRRHNDLTLPHTSQSTI